MRLGYPRHGRGWSAFWAVLLALALVAGIGGPGALAYVDVGDVVQDSPPPVTLSLLPAARMADPGQAVDVTLVVTSSVPLRSLQASLRFDPAVLQATSFDAGPFFKSWTDTNGGTVMIFPSPPPIDNTTGKVGVVSLNIMGGPNGGPSGGGLVGTFHLTVKPGTAGALANLSLQDVVVGDANLDSQVVATNPATVQVNGGGAGTPSPSPSPSPLPSGTAGPGMTATPTRPASATPTKPPPTHAATPTRTATAAQHVTLVLLPSSDTVAAGGTVDVKLQITSDIPLRTMQCTLTFDPAVLQASGFDQGTFFKSWADANGVQALVYPDPPPIDNTKGKVGVASITILGSTPGGPSGSGDFGTFHLTVKSGATGQGVLGLQDVQVGDANSDGVAGVTITGAAVSVSANLPTTTAMPTATTANAPTSTSMPTATHVPAPSATRVVNNTATPTATTSRTTTTRVSLSPASQSVAPGSLFDVSVLLEPDQAINNAQCGLTFDPALVEVKSVSQGDLLKTYATAHGGTTLMFPSAPTINNAAGTVEATSVAIMGAGEGGPSSSGVLLIYHMAAKAGAGGTSPLRLTMVVLGNAQSEGITGETVTDGQVTLDVNAPTPTASPTRTASSGVVATSTAPIGPTPAGTSAVLAAALAGLRPTATAGAARTVAGATVPAGASSAGAAAVGGAMAPTPPPAVVDLAQMVGADNTMSQELSTRSGPASVRIPAGTRALMPDGQPMRNISIKAVDRPPKPPSGKVIVGLAFEYEPTGATFTPPIDVSLAYDPAALPRGAKAKDLTLAFYDDKTGKWVELPQTLDAAGHTLTASVTHFTIFAVLARKPGSNWLLIFGMLMVEIVAGFGIAIYVKKRRRRRRGEFVFAVDDQAQDFLDAQEAEPDFVDGQVRYALEHRPQPAFAPARVTLALPEQAAAPAVATLALPVAALAMRREPAPPPPLPSAAMAAGPEGEVPQAAVVRAVVPPAAVPLAAVPVAAGGTPTAAGSPVSGEVILTAIPSATMVQPGQRFDVDVLLETGVPLRSVQCGLSFDARLIEVMGVEKGALLSDFASARGGETELWATEAPSGNGHRTVVVGIRVGGAAGEGGVAGVGVFATYHVRAKHGVQGGSSLELNSIVIGDGPSDAPPGVDVIPFGGHVGVRGHRDGGPPSTAAPASVATQVPAVAPPTASPATGAAPAAAPLANPSEDPVVAEPDSPPLATGSPPAAAGGASGAGSQAPEEPRVPETLPAAAPPAVVSVAESAGGADRPKAKTTLVQRHGRRLAALLLLLLVLLPLTLLAVVGRGRNTGHAVRMWGAADLIPLGQRLQAATPAGIAIRWSDGPPGERLAGLRRGAVDAVLLGYDPTAEELAGLSDTVIAADAIVFLVDENSWQGGSINLGRPVADSQPVHGLELADVKGFLTSYSTDRKARWRWPGSYARWGYCSDGPNGGYTGYCAEQPPEMLQPRQTFAPGRFDTQTALYRSLGLDERQLAAAWPAFSHGDLTREEEVLATEYADASLFSAGQDDFQFRITYASLRVAQLALRHVPVKVLAIGSVDPVAQPQAVSDGRYPLRRRIHLITRAQEQGPARQLATWLEGPPGQHLMADAGYLPLAAPRSAAAPGAP